MAGHHRQTMPGVWVLTGALLGLVAILAGLVVLAVRAPAGTDTGLRPIPAAPAITWRPPVAPTGSAPTAARPTPPPHPSTTR